MICLLCLKENANVQSSIAYNSTEWQDLNIQHILEKYLWKMVNLNHHSYMCQVCWTELCNFHNFYTKIEEAHSNLSHLIKSEVVSDVGFSEEGELAEKKLSIGTETNQLELEFLLFKEETPLELFEKEDVNEVGTLNKTAKRKRSNGIKSTNDLENTANSQLESEFLLLKEEDLLGNFEKEDVYKLKNRPKRKCSSTKGIKSANDMQNTAKSNSKKRRNKKTITSEVNKSEETDLNQDKSDLKLEVLENYSKKTKIDENIDNRHDTKFESDDILSSTDSSKLDQLQDYDKFIAEHLQMACSLCHIPLDTFSILIKHYKEQHNQRGYVFCCDRRFCQRSDLIHHIKSHKNPDYFKCRQCHKILGSRICLKLHTKNIHQQKNFECDICGKTLSTALRLKTHKLLHDADNMERIPCNQCDKSYITKVSLANHIRTVHLKKYHKICDLCGATISCETSFKRHMLEHEGKARPMLSCKFCGRLLAEVGSLNRHIASHHPPKGIKSEFKCNLCAKVFAVPTNLKKHIKVVHENIYERKCSLCEKILRTPKALKDHMSRHVGKPLNVCDFCPKTFYSGGVKYAHQKRVHPIEWRESAKKNYSGDLPEKYKIV